MTHVDKKSNAGGRNVRFFFGKWEDLTPDPSPCFLTLTVTFRAPHLIAYYVSLIQKLQLLRWLLCAAVLHRMRPKHLIVPLMEMTLLLLRLLLRLLQLLLFPQQQRHAWLRHEAQM